MGKKYMYGIDVSHHNNEKLIYEIMEKNFNTEFVIAKATEGKKFQDKAFDGYMQQAGLYGILRGAYHYVNSNDMDIASAMEEVRNFLTYVRPYGDCLLALDFEEKKMLNERGVNYLALIAANVKLYTGVAPLIYMSESTYKTLDFSELVKIGCGLWAAKWGKNNAIDLNAEIYPSFQPAVATPFSCLAIQQISSKAIWNDKNVALDVDIAFMDATGWKKYANPRFEKGFY